jgi:hypothetical protein
MRGALIHQRAIQEWTGTTGVVPNPSLRGGVSRSDPFSPCPLVLAALLVGAATSEKWIISG